MGGSARPVVFSRSKYEFEFEFASPPHRSSRGPTGNSKNGISEIALAACKTLASRLRALQSFFELALARPSTRNGNKALQFHARRRRGSSRPISRHPGRRLRHGRLRAGQPADIDGRKLVRGRVQGRRRVFLITGEQGLPAARRRTFGLGRIKLKHTIRTSAAAARSVAAPRRRPVKKPSSQNPTASP